MRHTSNALIGIAGVHHVVSELSRRGFIALPTVKNTAAYDIVVLAPDGRKHRNIQVKTSHKRVSFFRMPASETIRVGPRDFYVLARWIETDKRFECFLLSSRATKAHVKKSEQFQHRQIRKMKRKKTSLVPSIYVARKNKKAADSWRKAWDTWYP